MKSKALLAVGGLLVGVGLWLAVMPMLAPGLFSREATPEPLEKYGSLPAFELTDQQGQRISRESLGGKVWVADFMFTHCTAICPALTANMAHLQTLLKNDGLVGEARLVSFSVDPQRDTVERLAEYAKMWNADPAMWSMLTGPREAIWTLCRDGFKLMVADTPEDPVNPITHTGKMVLVDRAGVLRGYYDGLDRQDVERLAADVKRLVEEETDYGVMQ